MSKTRKVITEAIPPDYASLPAAERREISLRLAGQLQSGLRPPGIGDQVRDGKDDQP